LIFEIPATGCLNLGGLVVCFQPGVPEIRLSIPAGYLDFITGAAPDMTLRVHAGPPPVLELGRPRFKSANWSLYTQDGVDWVDLSMRSPGPYMSTYVLRLPSDGSLGDLFIQDEPPAPPIRADYECPPRGLDEVLTLLLLFRHGGLLAHACGLCLDNQTGYLFAGVSGSGKSTTARLWHAAGAARLLSDERVAVIRRAGHFWIAGTPWHSDGGFSAPLEAPLRRLFVLQHSPTNRLRPLSPRQAVTALLERSFYPYWDGAGMAATFDLLQDLCAQIPCFELGFVPDQSAVDFVRCLS
jgi:hypothetical protein